MKLFGGNQPMRNRHARMTAITLVIILGSIYAVAQASLGGISGVVRDNSGAVISGAKVTLLNEATGDKSQATTSSEGNFAFSQLNVGSYTVKIEAPNFRTGL